jgi:GTP-binding protein LepA
MHGTMRSGSKLTFMQAGANHEAIEIGVRKPVPTLRRLSSALARSAISSPGIKDVADARSGETVTSASGGSAEALPATATPSRWCSPGCSRSTATTLRTCASRWRSSSSTMRRSAYAPESSGALGFGFRCGFLGLLHMEIVKERLEREFGLALIATAPSVEYRLTRTDGTIELVDNPADMPEAQKIATIEEPFFKVSIITPTEYTGTLMDLCQKRRGEMKKMEYLSPERVELVYEVPLAEVVVDFFDQMKSRTKGYASLDYELSDYRPSALVKVDLLLNGLPADAFSTIVHRDSAYQYGARMCEKLKELIPRQMFDVPIQAAIGGKVIARETVKAKRKDVLAKCYGGDITRKRKLLEKQKEGKKKMKSIGRVEVPGDVFINALKLDD